MSPSPNSSIISLLDACREGRALVTNHYSLIFPVSRTWFSFTKDSLYLDWGSRYFTTIYSPQHFLSSWDNDACVAWYGHPECSMDIIKQVKNLAICMKRWPCNYSSEQAEFLVGDLLPIFTAVEVLVLADRFHSREESGEELTWLKGGLGNELDGWEQFKFDARGQDTEVLRKLLLWKDKGDERAGDQ